MRIKISVAIAIIAGIIMLGGCSNQAENKSEDTQTSATSETRKIILDNKDYKVYEGDSSSIKGIEAKGLGKIKYNNKKMKENQVNIIYVWNKGCNLCLNELKSIEKRKGHHS